MAKQLDYRIEFLRFVFCIIIMLFHSWFVNWGTGHVIPLGHVFVEFFFFISGYFTYDSLREKLDKVDMRTYPFVYTSKKFKRIIPYAVMTVFLDIEISLFFNCFVRHDSIGDLVVHFHDLPFEILFLHLTGICTKTNFNAWWYLSALLLLLPLVIILFYKKITCGGVYTYIIYAVPLLIYGAFSSDVNGLDWERQVLGVLKSGLFRGFAGLCTGCMIFDAKERIHAIYMSSLGKLWITILELGSYIFSILVAWKWSDVTDSSFIVVLLLAVGLMITFSRKSYSIVLDKSFFSFFGSISIPLYICHFTIGRLIKRFYEIEDIFMRYIVYFLASFAFAIIMIKTQTFVQKVRHEYA